MFYESVSLLICRAFKLSPCVFLSVSVDSCFSIIQVKISWPVKPKRNLRDCPGQAPGCSDGETEVSAGRKFLQGHPPGRVGIYFFLSLPFLLYFFPIASPLLFLKYNLLFPIVVYSFIEQIGNPLPTSGVPITTA